jgi:hypothetical protein
MEFITALKLLHIASMASKSFLSSSKEEKASEASKNYLRIKYNLGQYHSINQSWALVGGSGGFYSYGDEWVDSVTNVLRKIMRKSEIDEELYILCGELAMFATVIDHTLDFEGKPRILFQHLNELNGTETYISLIEMGRGRGSDYALKLIKNELRKIFWLSKDF